MDRPTAKWFVLCVFVATVAWYVALLASFLLKLLPHQHAPPPDLAPMYRGDFFDEFQKKIFAVLLILFAVVAGVAMRQVRGLEVRNARMLALGTTASVLFIPLAMVGAFGLATSSAWPAGAPPISMIGGGFWLLPGAVLLAETGRRWLRGTAYG